MGLEVRSVVSVCLTCAMPDSNPSSSSLGKGTRGHQNTRHGHMQHNQLLETLNSTTVENYKSQSENVMS